MWLCTHPGVCSYVHIQEYAAMYTSRSMQLCTHPGVCGYVHIQEYVAMYTSRSMRLRTHPGVCSDVHILEYVAMYTSGQEYSFYYIPFRIFSQFLTLSPCACEAVFNSIQFNSINVGVLATKRAWAKVTYRQTDRQTDYCNPSCRPRVPRVNKLT